MATGIGAAAIRPQDEWIHVIFINLSHYRFGVPLGLGATLAVHGFLRISGQLSLSWRRRRHHPPLASHHPVFDGCAAQASGGRDRIQQLHGPLSTALGYRCPATVARQAQDGTGGDETSVFCMERHILVSGVVA